MSVPRWAPPIVWGAFILVLTSLPASTIPQAPYFPGADKVVHAALYAVLGALAARALARTTKGAIVGAFLVLALFGAADEWHQQFVPGRYQDVADWTADALGGAIGISLALMTRRRREPAT